MNTNDGLSLWRDTWGPVSEFRREFDRLFDDWATSTVRGLGADQSFVPTCEVEEADDRYLLTLEIPGISRDEIKVEVVENQVVISGERKHERKQSANNAWYSERRFGKFQRSFTLPAGVDVNKIEATHQDGILHMMVPKAESAKPRQIKITSGDTGFFSKLFAQPENEKRELHSSNGHRKESVAS